MPTTTDDLPHRSRASRMSPDDRRAAIIEATIPLVRKHGYAVTTRQIADAAGVAEGTLFRVFDDKNQLIHEAICTALEPTGLERRIAAIDPALPLRDRLVEATRLVQQRLMDVFELLAAVRLAQPPGGDADRPPPHQHVLGAIEGLIEPDRAAFRVAPSDVARLLRVLTFAGSHAGITDGNTMTPDEIVAVLLDGVLVPPAHPRPGDSPC